MAFSCTNTSLVASRPFISYVVPTSKTKRKQKPKVPAVERSIVEVDSPGRRDGFRIDDFPAPCSDVSPPLSNTSAPTCLAVADAPDPQTHHTIGPSTSTSQEHPSDTRTDVIGDLDGSSVWQELENFNGNSQR